MWLVSIVAGGGGFHEVYTSMGRIQVRFSAWRYIINYQVVFDVGKKEEKVEESLNQIDQVGGGCIELIGGTTEVGDDHRRKKVKQINLWTRLISWFGRWAIWSRNVVLAYIWIWRSRNLKDNVLKSGWFLDWAGGEGFHEVNTSVGRLQVR